MEELELQEGRALAVVAHPDDETIWMGGTILKFPNVQWTIFSLCRGDDPDRAPKFKRVCGHYGVRAIISDLEDEGIMNVEDSLPEIKKRILAELPEKRFDYIFTHGSNGEYGHPRHIGVHLAMKKLLEEQQIQSHQLFFFAYMADSRKRMKNDGIRANVATHITQDELLEKKDVVVSFYGFAPTSFEVQNCLPVETFAHHGPRDFSLYEDSYSQ